MYELLPDYFSVKQNVVKHIPNNAFIPFDPANSDYQKFKVDLTEGIELQDADGNVMTKEQVNEFLKTIP